MILLKIFSLFVFFQSTFSWDYCGPIKFSSTTQICCYGRVVIKNGVDSSCCGYQSYNPRWNVCCNGVILKKRIIDDHCCGHNLYNPNWKKCCYGAVISKKDNCFRG